MCGLRFVQPAGVMMHVLTRRTMPTRLPVQCCRQPHTFPMHYFTLATQSAARAGSTSNRRAPVKYWCTALQRQDRFDRRASALRDRSSTGSWQRCLPVISFVHQARLTHVFSLKIAEQ